MASARATETARPPEPASKPRRLGRGLSALLGVPSIEVPVTVQPGKTAPVVDVAPPAAAVDAPKVRDGQLPNISRIEGTGREGTIAVSLIPLGDIEPSRFQPRRVFDDATIKGLADSIRSTGLMQPVIVRRRPAAGAGVEAGAPYELVAGERRWRAAELAGLKTIPALVKDLPDEGAAQWALVENVQREDLNAMERAWAFRMLCEKFGLTQAEVAQRVGLDRASVANSVRLTELEDPIAQLIEAGRLSGGHGKALLSCAPGRPRVALAERAAREGWSVRRLELEAAALSAPSGNGATPAVAAVGEPGRLAARAALEKQLGEHLGTRVSIATDRTGTRGRLTMEFYGLDHFDGLLAKMGFRMK